MSGDFRQIIVSGTSCGSQWYAESLGSAYSIIPCYETITIQLGETFGFSNITRCDVVGGVYLMAPYSVNLEWFGSLASCRTEKCSTPGVVLWVGGLSRVAYVQQCSLPITSLIKRKRHRSRPIPSHQEALTSPREYARAPRFRSHTDTLPLSVPSAIIPREEEGFDAPELPRLDFCVQRGRGKSKGTIGYRKLSGIVRDSTLLQGL